MLLSERRGLKYALKRKEIWLKGTLKRKGNGLKTLLDKKKKKKRRRYKAKRHVIWKARA
jgi:hypothetical protein